MKICPICKIKVTDKKAAIYCLECRILVRTIQKRIGLNLSYAIKKGNILKAEGQLCVDCGNPAVCYDHRDYGKPLQVDPVCKKCNHHRGPAIGFGWRGDRAYMLRQAKLENAET